MDTTQPAKVVDIHTGDAVTSASVNCSDMIEMLEIALDEARTGQITGCALAFTRPNGTVSTRWAGAEKIDMIAAVSMLQHRFMTAVVADRS